MATMGLRINNSQRPIVDASLGKTLAEAYFGDTDTEIKLARLRDAQAMDEYQKRQYASATNLNLMNIALAAAKARDAEWQLSAKQGGIGPGAKVVLAAQQGGTGSVQPAEQPAVVETPAEPAAPSLPYQSVGGAGAYPVVASDVEPVPVVEGHVATSPTAAAAAPEEPPAPEPPVVDSIIRLPEGAEPAPVDEVPDFAPPQMASSPDAAYLLAQRGEGWDATSGAEGNLPVVIDGDSPSAHSVASITNTSDTDTEEVPTVAAAAQPVSATAATAPASVGSAPAPTAPADANPKPATPGPQPDANADPVLPATAQVPQQRPEVHPVPGTDKVVVKDGQGRIKIYNQQDAEAAVAAIIANGGDIQGAIGKLGGQLGILTDPTLTSAQKEAILLGHLPSKDSILGPQKGLDVGDIVVIDGVSYTKDIDANGNRILTLTPGGPQKGPADPYQSKSAETDYQRIIDNVQAKFRAGQPITPEEASQYDRAVAEQYGTKYEFRAGPDDTTIRVPVDPARPLILASPTAVYKAAGVNAPATPAPDKTVQTTDAQGNPVISSNVPAGGANPDDAELGDYRVEHYDPLSSQPIKVVYQGKRKMTELENKNTGFYIMSSRAAKELDKMTGETAPDPITAALTNPANTGGWQGVVKSVMSNPQTREYWVNAMNFANAVLRSETGAATRPEELDIVMTRFIPQRGDDARVIELKRQSRQAVLEAQRRGALGDHPTADELAAYADQRFALPDRAAPAPAPATAPATAPAAPDTTAPAAAAPAAAPAGDTYTRDNPAKPVTDADFSKLPDGAVFLDPDTKELRVKKSKKKQ